MRRVVGAVCGLKSEAAALRAACARGALGDLELALGVSAADAARAEKIAGAFAAEGAAAILSIGISGGLDPMLRPGDLVLASAVVGEGGERYAAEERLTRAMLAAHAGEGRKERASGAGGEARARRLFGTGILYGSNRIIASPGDKAAIFAATGAVAVDMESLGAARAAARAGTPFAAIRAIADPAQRALPRAALGAVAANGSPRVLATLLECAKAPGDFPALVRLGRDSATALKTLRRDLGALLGGLLLGLEP